MIKYEIEGGSLPVVICYPEMGQTLCTQSGAMSWMSPNMKMDTNSGGGIKKALGIAPIYGPKKGITLVIPTIRLIRVTYGSFKRCMQIKQMIPMIRESMIFPVINPPNIRSHCLIVSRIKAFTERFLETAYNIFLACPRNLSFSNNT